MLKDRRCWNWNSKLQDLIYRTLPCHQAVIWIFRGVRFSNAARPLCTVRILRMQPRRTFHLTFAKSVQFTITRHHQNPPCYPCHHVDSNMIQFDPSRWSRHLSMLRSCVNIWPHQLHKETRWSFRIENTLPMFTRSFGTTTVFWRICREMPHTVPQFRFLILSTNPGRS